MELRLVRCEIPETQARNGRAWHPWVQRHYSYVRAAVRRRATVEDVAQELACMRAEDTGHLMLGCPVPPRPVRCAECIGDARRCALCADAVRAWRVIARYGPNRVANRILRFAIRRAIRAHRDVESLPPAVVVGTATCQRPGMAATVEEALVVIRDSKLRDAYAALSAEVRERFRLMLWDVARHAIASRHARPDATVRTYATRMLKAHYGRGYVPA